MLKLDLKAHKAVIKPTYRKLRPRKEWVLIEKISPDEKSVGALVVDMSTSKSYRAVVLEVGEKVLDLKPGDEVLISNFPMEIEDVDELVSGPESLTNPSLRRQVFLVRDEEIYCGIEAED